MKESSIFVLLPFPAKEHVFCTNTIFARDIDTGFVGDDHSRLQYGIKIFWV